MSLVERMRSGAGMSSNIAAAANWQIDGAALALCLLLSCGAYFAAVGPMLASRDDRAAHSLALTETRDQATRMVADTRAIRTLLNNAQTDLAKIEIPLQTPAAVNQRLAELTGLAGECGLEVQAMQPGTLVNSQRYAQLPIQVSGTGSYRTCMKFLHSLRQRFPDTAMKAFELSASPTEPNTPTSFNFQLAWFVQPGPDAKR